MCFGCGGLWLWLWPVCFGGLLAGRHDAVRLGFGKELWATLNDGIVEAEGVSLINIWRLGRLFRSALVPADAMPVRRQSSTYSVNALCVDEPLRQQCWRSAVGI